MSLLQPSTQLGRARKTQKQVLNDVHLQGKLYALGKPARPSCSGHPGSDDNCDDLSQLVGTTWGRKCRKRRRLKAEKVLFDPKPASPVQEEALLSSESESLESEETLAADNRGTSPVEGRQYSESDGDGMDSLAFLQVRLISVMAEWNSRAVVSPLVMKGLLTLSLHPVVRPSQLVRIKKIAYSLTVDYIINLRTLEVYIIKLID